MYAYVSAENGTDLIGKVAEWWDRTQPAVVRRVEVFENQLRIPNGLQQGGFTQRRNCCALLVWQ